MLSVTRFPWIRRLFALPAFLAFFLTSFLMMSPCLSAFADEPNKTVEEAVGHQAFLDFFGPDGVNDCLQTDSDETSNSLNDIPAFVSSDQAVLTTVWENVGNGRINRKYLNGLVAFCYDEELAFPNGAVYEFATASEAATYGQVAAIAQRFGQSGVDNAQWWNECQVAIWAARAGCQSYDSAAAFARSYCADRKITDPATVEDYAYIVGSLVSESVGANGTAYLYQAADPANQRILTYVAVWPDPAPSYPSPAYERVSVEEHCTASRSHRIDVDHKSSSITGEALAGAVFEVYENDRLVGTITTDTQGKGSCQWTLSTTASAFVTKEYCSNYDQLDPDILPSITGYTNRDDAFLAAQQEALTAARTQAELQADIPCAVTIRESLVPTGFSSTKDSLQTVTLTGNDSAVLSAINTPWSSTLVIDKVDGITGERIPADATFTLYEWNGHDYELSPHYQILRKEDGLYTVASHYPTGEPGQLYYTQKNQGRFALAETTAPYGYYLDPDLFYFTIQQDQTILYGHNADPDAYDIQDDTKFANRPKPTPCYDTISAFAEASASRTHQLTLDRKTASITSEPLAGAVFQVCEDGVPVAVITSDAFGQGSCQWEVTETAQATVSKSYCSNYDLLEAEEKNTVTGFPSKEAAFSAALTEARIQAQAQADQLADRPRTVTIKEISVPDGFSPLPDDLSEMILTGDDSSHFSVTNTPWSATLLLDKVDGITGETISADATFALYEWNGTDYERSPHYRFLRREDGMYTVVSDYPDGLAGHLYYTQKNQGRFALAETTAPNGYLLDPKWFVFEITADGQTFFAHNAVPDRYPINDSTAFANQAVTGTIQITKTGDYLTEAALPDPNNPLASDPAHTFEETSLFHAANAKQSFYTHFQYMPLPVSGASFAIYNEEGILVTTITTDDQGIARLEGLSLGTYTIRETSVGEGDFLLDPTLSTVTLSYQDPFTAVVVDDSTHYHNQRQKILLELTKKSRPLPDVFSVIPEHSSPELPLSQHPLPGAVYGLYAAEDFYGYLWNETEHSVSTTAEPLIPAHTLLEKATTDNDGVAVFQSDLPCGKYYVRELEAPIGYLLDETTCPIDASYTGQDGETCLHLSYSFTNDPIPLQETLSPTAPEAPTPPEVPTALGAPTGDDNPFALSFWCLLGSLSLLISFGLALLSKKED